MSLAHCRITTADSNINLEFQKAKHLIDGGFVFIRRYENSSVLIKDFDKLAEKYADCFYRNENSALDVCDGNVVSFQIRFHDRLIWFQISRVFCLFG